MEELKMILSSQALGPIDKLIQVDRMVYGEEWTAEGCAERHGLSVLMVNQEPDIVATPVPKAKKVHVKEYVAVFEGMYLAMKTTPCKITDADKKYLCKIRDEAEVDLPTFERICWWLIARHKENLPKSQVNFTLWCFLETPTIHKIYKDINFFLTESAQQGPSGGWGYSFIKKDAGQ